MTKKAANKLPLNGKRASDPTSRNRPPLERMLRIHQEISSGNYPNGSTLARDFEVSTKSIQRDIDFMRDRMELPIAYDNRKLGFYYSRPVSSFPTLQISEGELVALLVAEKALQQYRGTTFERPLVSGLKKLAAQLPDTVSFNLSEWNETISFRTRGEPIVNLELFEMVTRATAERKQLAFEYRKPGQETAEPRLVDPYHLANINGEWFLFAYDHARQDIRTFVPARMSDVRQTGKTFARPEKFSLEQRLHNSFGVVSGEETAEVVIRFSRYAADFIREKRWHPSQELRELRSGEIELRMTLSSVEEVQRWILSWGGHARAISPKRLVDAVQEAARRILGEEPAPTTRKAG